MNSIDWSKAPDSATHLVKCTDPKFEREYWCVESGDRYNNVASDAWLAKDSVGKNGWLVFARPTPWRGEVLPPVGQHVHIYDPEGVLMYGAGEDGEVIAHVEDTAVVRMSYGLGCFVAKHLRTTEQIAADERENGIAEMRKVLASNAKGSIESSLWDAGYRKVTP